MTPEELDPHFDIIEDELGIHIAGEELFNENNRLVMKGCDALGVEGGAVPTARIDCIACGWTQFGCPYNRKTSQLITTIPRISKIGGRIYSDALVDEIIVEGGRARGVRGSLIDRRTGAVQGTIEVEAGTVVLAGGALGTAELLLRNFDDPTVGKRFYINPHYFVFADFGREIDNVTGIPCAYSVHEWRRVETTADGRYAGGGDIMLCSHQLAGIIAAMLPECWEAHTERIREYIHSGQLLSELEDAR